MAVQNGKYERYGGAVQNPIGADIRLTDVPDDIELIPVQLTAEDGAPSRGLLYRKKGVKPKVGVWMGHPRADLYANYNALPLAMEGYAVLAVVMRWPNNDVATTHEHLILDVAAGLKRLQEEGCEKLVFVGNSGGSAISTFYQWQATAPKGQRLTETPAGDPIDLNNYDLPPADGLVLIGPHIGQGGVLLKLIDPSVVDENDPLACDPDLDMYNPKNGFVMPPASSKYSEEFLTKYRAAQVARVKRLDEKARSILNRQREMKEVVKMLGDKASLDQIRASVVEHHMIIYRGNADPAVTDLSIEPDDRPVRSYHTTRPDLENYDFAAFARVITPRAWLSTWSGLSSNCRTIDNLRGIKEPVVIIQYAADAECRTSEVRGMLEAAAGPDKELHVVRNAEHFGRLFNPDATLGERTYEGVDIMVKWIKDRFPAV